MTVVTVAGNVPPRRRTRLRSAVSLLGPAFVAAIAYVDPGNVATNVSAGARYGTLLLWVIVGANLMAFLVQYLSAKLGLVTGESLPRALGTRLPKPARIAYWVQAELVAAATDAAEVIGGAVALELLLGVPLLLGGLATGALSLALLVLQNRHGQRRFEAAITVLLAVVAAGFVVAFAVSPPGWSDTAAGLVPRFHGSGSVLLAAGMVGATVMPHAIYLHSGLADHRYGRPAGARLTRLLKATRWDVGLAMAVAGAVNVALLLLAAGALRSIGGLDSLQGVHAAIGLTLGSGVALLFAVGLFASGLASTAVGSCAGALIMDGLLWRRVPILVRRLATLVPAVAVLAVGVDPTWALVASQVILSFGIPFALVPLVLLTASGRVMGTFANGPLLNLLAGFVTAVVVTLNVALVYLTFSG
jgi:manganese transport protein